MSFFIKVWRKIIYFFLLLFLLYFTLFHKPFFISFPSLVQFWFSLISRFVDKETLYKHLRKDHYFCHFCDADGAQFFFSEYSDLRSHFRSIIYWLTGIYSEKHFREKNVFNHGGGGIGKQTSDIYPYLHFLQDTKNNIYFQ